MAGAVRSGYQSLGRRANNREALKKQLYGDMTTIPSILIALLFLISNPSLAQENQRLRQTWDWIWRHSSRFTVPYEKFAVDMTDDRKRYRTYLLLRNHDPDFTVTFDEFSVDILGHQWSTESTRAKPVQENSKRPPPEAVAFLIIRTQRVHSPYLDSPAYVPPFLGISHTV
jgi:hypothetical protein